MKKFFTLIAMALVAMGAMAQGKFIVTEAIADGTVVSSVPGISVTFSDTWTVKDKAAVEYNGTTYSVCVGGAANPSPSPKNGEKVPTSGCFIKFTPAAEGTVTLIANVNSGKNVWLFKDETKMESFTVNTGSKANGTSFGESYAGPISWEVEANATYTIALEGSKLMAYGFEYATSSEAEETEPTVSVPESMKTFVGTEISLTASATGYPTPTIAWYQTADNAAAGGQKVGEGASYKFTPDAAGTFYFYAVAENSKGKATSNICTVTATETNIYLSEDNEIIFTPECIYAAGQLDGVTIHGGALHLLIKDGAGKVSTEKSTAYFGTEDAYDKIEGRMKVAGKYDKVTDTNALKLTSDSDGTLYVYAKSGSSNARALVFTQNGDVLFDDLFANSDAITVTRTNSEGVTEEKTVYPVYSFDIQAGEIDITRPNDTMQIYGFSLDKNVVDGIKTVTEKAENAAIYNIAGQRVNAHVKGMKIQNGKKYIQK